MLLLLNSIVDLLELSTLRLTRSFYLVRIDWLLDLHAFIHIVYLIYDVALEYSIFLPGYDRIVCLRFFS